jgi:dienelactone hydrolase
MANRSTPDLLASLEEEILNEMASSLGRIARRLEGHLATLARLGEEFAAAPAARRAALRAMHVEERRQAELFRWYLVVQREAIGLRDPEGLGPDYQIPPPLDWGAERFARRSFTSSRGFVLPYRLFRPASTGPVPLVLFLHGAGERGDDNQRQLAAGEPNGALVWATPEWQAQHPCLVVAPQCPVGSRWVEVPFEGGSYTLAPEPAPALHAALELVDALDEELAIARRYLTGLSMGGYGAWDAIVRRPERFAAAVPLAGGGDPTQAARLVGLPIWAFHGELDPVVPVSGSREMVAALERAGGAPRYTEYAGADHEIWNRTYADPSLAEWLFSR